MDTLIPLFMYRYSTVFIYFFDCFCFSYIDDCILELGICLSVDESTAGIHVQ